VEIASDEIFSIQVNSGAEFMADFETTCKQIKIPLIVMPPASRNETVALRVATVPFARNSMHTVISLPITKEL
jgi:hypothetical protein